MRSPVLRLAFATAVAATWAGAPIARAEEPDIVRGQRIDAFAEAASEPLNESVGDYFDVRTPFAERGKVNGKDMETEVEIFTESALADHGFQIAIGGGDHPDVDLDGAGPAERLEFPFLEHSKKFGLQLERQFANLVEEERPMIGEREPAFTPGQRTGAGRDHQRHEAQDEGEARHHHRAEAQPRTLDRRFAQAHPRLAPLDRELDDEDRVLGGERDQHDQADLRIDVEGEAEEADRGDRPERADGDREEDGDRDVPALVERHQEKIREQHREPEHDRGLACGLLLLQRRAGPLEAVAGRQHLLRDALHRGERCA